jgi:hypothetical protein
VSASDLPQRLAEAIRTRTAIAPAAGALTVDAAYDLQDELIDLLDVEIDASMGNSSPLARIAVSAPNAPMRRLVPPVWPKC